MAQTAIKVLSSARPVDPFGRDKPVIALGLAMIILVAHHFYVAAAEEGFFFVLWGMPALGALGLAGLIHPPIYYTITNKASLVPTWAKVVAAIVAAAGLALGIFIESVLYDFPNPYTPVQ